MHERLSPLPFTFGLMLVYLALMFVFPDLLPERMSRDAATLVDMMEGTTEADNSFVVTARMFAIVPEMLLEPAIAALGLLTLTWLAGGAFSFSAQGLMALLLLPLMLLDLLRPQKEVFVVALSLVAAWGVIKLPARWLGIALVLALYGLYGFYVRQYFLIIPVVWVGLLVFAALKPAGRMLASMALVLAILLLPAEIFDALQGPRDAVNILRVAGDDGNRTIFTNPWVPDNPFAFMGNYIYAALRLHVPVLFHQTPTELFLMASVIGYALLLRAGMMMGDARTRALALLFMAHMLVLVLFEPDLGSYLRHISSVLVYLWPAFMVWQATRIDLPARHPLLGLPLNFTR